jgi:hypothetical protein
MRLKGKELLERNDENVGMELLRLRARSKVIVKKKKKKKKKKKLIKKWRGRHVQVV